MNDNNRKLFRAFYQGLATAEEKATFLAMMGMSKDEKLAKIIELGIKDSELAAAILAATGLTKADRIAIASNIVRQFIFKLLGL